jgi:hypothetical protein
MYTSNSWKHQNRRILPTTNGVRMKSLITAGLCIGGLAMFSLITGTSLLAIQWTFFQGLIVGFLEITAFIAILFAIA